MFFKRIEFFTGKMESLGYLIVNFKAKLIGKKTKLIGKMESNKNFAFHKKGNIRPNSIMEECQEF
jgi:hypothetical protein